MLDFLDDLPDIFDPPVLDDGLKAPFPYFGGKQRAAELVWSRFGDVTNYVEPFFGSGAVLLARPSWHKARVETVNDLDALVVNVWRAVAADPENVARIVDWPVFETDLHAKHRWLIARRRTLAAELEADPRAYDLEAAAWWMWGASCWIGTMWCADTARRQLPALAGNGDSAYDGRGVHSAGQRSPSRRIPDVSAGRHWDGETAQPRGGKGMHGEGMRNPSRQLPDLGGSMRGDERWPNNGKGLNGFTQRTRLYETFERLAARLRYVRFACGDWHRVCTKAVTWAHGLTGIFLDPPYEGYEWFYMDLDAAKKDLNERMVWTVEDVRVYLALREAERERAERKPPVSAIVRAWALEQGAREDMRIALCGYEGDHGELEAAGWSGLPWKARGGYANQGQGQGRENSRKERIWFSPHCVQQAKNLSLWAETC